MTAIFDGLDDIPWGQIRDAYGPAESVPVRLRELLSSDVEDRAFAIDQLNMGICHQGSVAEATAYAVPFLVELARSSTVEGKADILMLLGNIAGGAHAFLTNRERQREEIVQGCIRYRSMTQEEAKAAFLAVQDWNARALDAVDQGCDAYLALARDDGAEVRLAAAYALVALARAGLRASEITRYLVARLDVEADDRVRAVILRGLFLCGTFTPVVSAHMIAALDDTAMPAARYHAALGLVYRLGNDAPPAAIDLLFDRLSGTPSHQAWDFLWADAYTSQTWDIGQDIDPLEALSRLDPVVVGSRLPRILRMIDKGFDTWVVPILRMIFGSDHVAPSQLAALSPDQRAVLERIAGNTTLWTGANSGAPKFRAARFGLPDTREALQAFLARS